MKKYTFDRSRRGTLGVGIVVACLLTGASIKAQNKDTIATQKLDEVTVKAVRMPRQVMAPVPVQVLSGDKIEKLGLQNMADAVRRFSGTTVRDYGGIGGLKTVSVRSLGAHHTGIAYDHVAVSNCQAGQIDIGRFSLDNVAMLSLAVGQEDNLLQSARLYASGAVLSIITELPSVGLKRSYGLKGQLRTGSFGQVNPYLKWTQKVGARTYCALDADVMRADGTYPFTLVNGKRVTTEKRYNSDIVAWHSEANVYHTFKDQATLNVKAYYFNSERGLPGSVIYYVEGNDERLRDENFFVQSYYEKRLSDKVQMQAQLKYNYSWNRYEKKDINGNADGKQIDVNRQQEYYGSSTVLYKPFGWLTCSLAQDVAVNTLTNNYTGDTNNANIAPVRLTSYTAFNVKLAWNRLSLIGGAINTFTHDKKGRKAPSIDRNQLTPSLSLAYKPFENHDLNLRLLYKKNYRLPSFNDLYYLQIGNTNLKPERATEYNLGVGWSRYFGGVVDYLMVNVDAFHNKVTDKIVVIPSTYVSKMSNYGHVDIDGIDLSAGLNLNLSKRVKVLLSGGYTYQRAVDLTNEKAKNYKDQIPYTPEHTGNGSLGLDTPYGHLTYSLVGVGKRYTLPQNIEANLVEGYVEQNLSYTKGFRWKRVDWSVQLECINLMDTQYDVIRFYPMPGRSFRATLKFTI
ncbi:MAG: TonB-dependent receptor [Bacteroidia bacterium]|nr:TonB-dependent receptor [Bacteroidia bacterium]